MGLTSLPSAACNLTSHVRLLSIAKWMHTCTWEQSRNFPVLESEYIICCQTVISKLCQKLLANFVRYLSLIFKQSDCCEKENPLPPNLCLDNCVSPRRHFDEANQMLSFSTATDGKLGGARIRTELLSNLTLTPKACQTSCLLYCKWQEAGYG